MEGNIQPLLLTPELITRYAAYLSEQEKASATISRYIHDLNALLVSLPDREITKSALIRWKEQLTAQYAASTVNLTLAALNGFLDFCGYGSLRLKPLKIQRELFCREEKELTHSEYTRLVRTAETQGRRRLSLVLQTICSTGIRVSELKFITLDAVRTGRAEVNNKGRRRTVFLPGRLRRVLTEYAGQQERTAGPVFLTKNGIPLDRSNIWREMKSLCEKAGVEPCKVFPHNLRHLFARTYYTAEKDLSRLADILGHSSIDTTRIYTMESGAVHAKQLDRLALIIT